MYEPKITTAASPGQHVPKRIKFRRNSTRLSQSFTGGSARNSCEMEIDAGLLEDECILKTMYGKNTPRMSESQITPHNSDMNRSGLLLYVD